MHRRVQGPGGDQAATRMPYWRNEQEWLHTVLHFLEASSVNGFRFAVGPLARQHDWVLRHHSRLKQLLLLARLLQHRNVGLRTQWTPARACTMAPHLTVLVHMVAFTCRCKSG